MLERVVNSVYPGKPVLRRPGYQVKGGAGVAATVKSRAERDALVADFSGNYVSISAGVAVAGGGSVTSLRNQNGVVIDGVTTAQGVRLTLAPGGVNIRLSGQPSS